MLNNLDDKPVSPSNRVSGTIGTTYTSDQSRDAHGHDGKHRSLPAMSP